MSVFPLSPIINRMMHFFHAPKKEACIFMEQIRKYASHPEAQIDHLWQLEVIDQQADGTGRRGWENCGYHATRNALSLLQFAADQKIEHLNALKDVDHYLSLYYSWEQKVPTSANGDRDLSISTISKILEEIRHAQPSDNLLHPFQEALRKVEKRQDQLPALSIANCLLLDNRLHYAVGGDAASLAAAANLWKIANSPMKKLDHLFIIGLSDLANVQHWVAVALHQEEGKREWVFMDSHRNQSIHARKVTESLEDLIHHKELFTQELYKTYVEDILSRRVVRLQSKEVDSETLNAYLQDEQMQQLCLHSARFMTQCEWLQHPTQHRQQIDDLAYLINFYAEELDRMHPLKRIFQVCLEGLGNAVP